MPGVDKDTTHYCPCCEALARELERLRAEVEDERKTRLEVHRHYEYHIGVRTEERNAAAKALELKCAEVERLRDKLDECSKALEYATENCESLRAQLNSAEGREQQAIRERNALASWKCSECGARFSDMVPTTGPNGDRKCASCRAVERLRALVRDLYEVAGWLMAGIGKITVPDYGRLNDALARAQAVSQEAADE